MSEQILKSVVIFFIIGFLTCSALDCRKFVFAPACRGIIAKRSDNIKPLLSHFRAANAWPRSLNDVRADIADREYTDDNSPTVPRESRQSQLNRDVSNNDVPVDAIAALGYNTGLRLF